MTPFPAAGSELDALLELADSLASEPLALEDVGGLTSAEERSPLRASSPAVDDKREKARAKERRKYYRKKQRLAGLQEQAAALEQQLQALMADDRSISSPERERSEPKSRREELQRRLVELEETKTRLRNENTQLRWQFRQAEQRAAFLSDTLYAEHKLYVAHSAHFRLLTPLSMQACSEIHAHALDAVRAFELATLSAPLVGSVAGWHERRVVDGHLFKFAMQKPFPRTSAKYACSQAWAMLLDPSRNRKLYSDVLDVDIRLVQRVDDDNYVFLEEMRSMDPDESGVGGQMVKSALLMSRTQISDSVYRIHMRALDRRLIEMEDVLSGEPVVLPHELWSSSEQLTWLQFQDRGGDQAVVTFAGMTPTIGANAYFWMAEVVLLCLRSESGILGPRFSLPSS